MQKMWICTACKMLEKMEISIIKNNEVINISAEDINFLNKMGKEFFLYFYTELRTLFSMDNITFENIEAGIESTIGWDEALKNACNKFNLSKEYNWYKNLNWDMSDKFDTKIGKKMLQILNIN